MTQKVFTYKPIEPKNTYRIQIVLFTLVALWFALAPILIETKEESHPIMFGLSAFIILVAWGRYRRLNRIIGYEKLAREKRIVLDIYKRHIRVEHKWHSMEFHRSDIRMVHLFDSTTRRSPVCYFGYMIIELKDGRKVLITKSLASEKQLKNGLYRAPRNRVRKRWHPVPKEIEF